MHPNQLYPVYTLTQRHVQFLFEHQPQLALDKHVVWSFLVFRLVFGLISHLPPSRYTFHFIFVIIFGSVPVAARSKAVRVLRLWVRIPPAAWMSVCCECCVLLGRGLCVGLITCPWGVLLPTVMRRRVWSRNLVNDESLAHWGAVVPPPQKKIIFGEVCLYQVPHYAVFSTALFSSLS